MSTEVSPATAWSLAFLTQLVASGIQHLVLSPGSRSQALALAADALSQTGPTGLQVHVCVDERTAGFYGLGLAIHAGVPTVLLCTSGSAPAHYLPALLEAKHSGVPLIAVTADRPVELRGVGANQTTDQVGLFGVGVHASIDAPAPESNDRLFDGATGHASDLFRLALSGAKGGRPGPVHLNIAFREPLSSPISADAIYDAKQRNITTEAESRPSGKVREVRIDPQPGTVVLAGHRAGPEAEELARDLGAVLIAEVHSGARFGKNLVVAYRELLDEAGLEQSITRVVCVGRPTLSRQSQRLLSRQDVEHIVWQKDEPEASNLSGNALVADVIRVSRKAKSQETRDWVAPWVSASREYLEKKTACLEPPGPDIEALSSDNPFKKAQFAKKEMAVVRRQITRRDIANQVWAHTWPDDQLVLGSSRMIREFDSIVPGKKIPVWSNRGLSGIDGTVATSRGIAAGRAHAGSAGVTRVVLGDLAFLHDAGSLLLQESEKVESRIQIVVVSDGGGSLFDALEVRGTADRASFERVMFTPAQANLNSLADAYSWHFLQVVDYAGLLEALSQTTTRSLVQCVVDRKEP